MYTKLTTPQQVDLLQEGHIVKKYPVKGLPINIFDELDTTQIDTYRIGSVSRLNIVNLIMTGDSIPQFPSAVDVGRLYIKSCDLVDEKVWWV